MHFQGRVVAITHPKNQLLEPSPAPKNDGGYF
jgi:hypothetical protein